ncbi:hypothetical protein [Ekhidna sp.]
MKDLSGFIKVSADGKLMMLDIKKENGQVIILGKEWEKAIEYACRFDIVSDLCNEMWKEVNSKKT